MSVIDESTPMSTRTRMQYFPKITGSTVYDNAVFFAKFIADIQEEQIRYFNDSVHRPKVVIIKNNYNGIDVVGDRIYNSNISTSSQTLIFSEEIHENSGEAFSTVPVHGEYGDGFVYNMHSSSIAECDTSGTGDWRFDNKIKLPYAYEITEEYIEQKMYLYSEDTIFMLLMTRLLHELKVQSFMCNWYNLSDYAQQYNLFTHQNAKKFKECLQYFYNIQKRTYEKV